MSNELDRMSRFLMTPTPGRSKLASQDLEGFLTGRAPGGQPVTYALRGGQFYAELTKQAEPQEKRALEDSTKAMIGLPVAGAILDHTPETRRNRGDLNADMSNDPDKNRIGDLSRNHPDQTVDKVKAMLRGIVSKVETVKEASLEEGAPFGGAEKTAESSLSEKAYERLYPLGTRESRQKAMELRRKMREQEKSAAPFGGAEKTALSVATKLRAAHAASTRADTARTAARAFMYPKAGEHAKRQALEGAYARRFRQSKKFQGHRSPADKDFTGIQAPTGGHWLKGVKPLSSSAAAVRKTEKAHGIKTAAPFGMKPIDALFPAVAAIAGGSVVGVRASKMRNQILDEFRGRGMDESQAQSALQNMSAQFEDPDKDPSLRDKLRRFKAQAALEMAQHPLGTAAVAAAIPAPAATLVGVALRRALVVP